MVGEDPASAESEDLTSTQRARHADQPIHEGGEDRLERGEFARALAEDIRLAPRSSGFVIALTGTWGEGKTSVLNLIETELTAGGEVDVVRFNPWLFSGTDQLVDHFFQELGGQLAATGKEWLEKISQGLAAYGRIVTPLRALPFVGGVLGATGQLATEGSQAMAGPEETAQARAEALREQLSALEQPILILVDDLDRLQLREIVDVIRLVRLVGDFPNLVYLLAFDRPRVEEALDGADRGRGRTYLEKIVQVMHSLPPVRPELLTELLQEDIAQVVGDVEPYHFDPDHFTNMFWGGFRDLFATVRDVRRYTNVLPATLRLVGNEVELADVLVLEALRVFVPDAFDGIVKHQAALTSADGGHRDDRRREAFQEQVQGLVRAAHEHASTVERLLPRLFPAAGRYFGGASYGVDSSGVWQRQRRVAHSAPLQAYLRRRLPPGALRAEQVDEIFAAWEDADRLDGLLGGLDPDQLEAALSRLQHYEGDFPTADPAVAIGILLRHGRRLPSRLRHFHDVGADVKLSRVVYLMLRKLDSAEVEELVRRVDYPDLSGRHEIVGLVGHRRGSGEGMVSQETATQLENELGREILEASARDLAAERRLARLVGFVLAAHPDKTQERVAAWSEDDDFFLALLESQVLESVGGTLGDAVKHRTRQLNWPALVDLLGQERLVERVRGIDIDQVPVEIDDETRAVWGQAHKYAENPSGAEQAVRRWKVDPDLVEDDA